MLLLAQLQTTVMQQSHQVKVKMVHRSTRKTLLPQEETPNRWFVDEGGGGATGTGPKWSSDAQSSVSDPGFVFQEEEEQAEQVASGPSSVRTTFEE